ncbi:MAG: transporter substrate-binding domain-containing protein [Limisphaerales bacterium]
MVRRRHALRRSRPFPHDSHSPPQARRHPLPYPKTRNSPDRLCHYPPRTFLTPEGRPTGESVDLTHQVASALGVENVEWLLTGYGSLTDELIARRFDLVACGTFPHTDGYPDITTSIPTSSTHSTLIVQRNNPLEIHSTLDLLQHPSIRVAVISQSPQETRLQQTGFPKDRLISAPNTTAGHAMVRLNAADAFLLPHTSAHWILQQQPVNPTQLATPFSDTLNQSTNPASPGGFLFLKSDIRLLKAWNQALAQVLQSREYPQLAREPGTQPNEIPLRTP